jgi:multiple sugar transport system ATP-binding protein
MAGIAIQDLRKSFGAGSVLDGVSLDIMHGEFLSLVGPSGCGKSTLLRIIAGLDHADAGSIAIGGRAVDDLPPKARDVAMVFQSYALYPYMTVAENIGLPLVMRRMNGWQRMPLLGRATPGAGQARAAIDAEVRAVAEGLGLGHLLGRRPGQLSGGQRQRVALARAMVRSPAAFLMDEPLSNLDAKLRVQARAEIADLHRRLGATFVYVTHDQVEAMTMSDRVAVMLGGSLLQVAPPQTVYDEPASLEVARFIGTPEINVLPGRVRQEGVEILGRLWPLDVSAAAGAMLSLGVRPEALGLDLADSAGRSPAIPGRIRHLERLGSETLAHVGVEGLERPLVARVEPHAGAELTLGAPASVTARLSRVLAFAESTGARVPVRHSPEAARARPRELAYV